MNACSRAPLATHQIQSRMMKIAAGMTVGDLIRDVPGAETVFEIVRIDSCCRRDRSLADASAAAGIDVDEVITLMRELALDASAHPATLSPDTPLNEITVQIRDQYHRRARAFLVLLTRSARTLSGSHGQAFPEIWHVRTQIERLARQLVPHMSMEEKYLFPYIESLAGGHADREIVVPLTGKVEYPLQFVKHEHEHDIQMVSGLRVSTHDFTPPERSCGGFSAFYGMLREFAAEIEEHIALENDVLFPRAIDAEKQIFERSGS